MITRRNLFKTLFVGLTALFVGSNVKAQTEENITGLEDAYDDTTTWDAAGTWRLRYCDICGTQQAQCYIYYDDGTYDVINEFGEQE